MHGATAHSGPRPPSNGAPILLHFIRVNIAEIRKSRTNYSDSLFQVK